MALFSLQLCGNSEHGRLNSLAVLCLIFFSVSIIYLCYFKRGFEIDSSLSCFVIGDGGDRKRYLVSRNNGSFETLEQKWQKGKILPLTEPRLCCRFSILSVHKSECSLMFSVCKRLWSPFCQAFWFWRFTSALILISYSAENEMPKCSSVEIFNTFYLLLY